MRQIHLSCLWARVLVWGSWCSAIAAAQQKPLESSFAEIQVVDPETGRGVPLAELETVHNVVYVTDNGGRVAIDDPDVVGHETFFFVRSHGYEFPPDGFGFRGIRLTPSVGKPARVELPRAMPAERLCRLTGLGRFRDSRLLGYPPVPTDQLPSENVAGQDGCVAVEYRGQHYFFWGDTSQLRYPLGMFRVAGATAPLPDIAAGRPVELGLVYSYFVDPQTGFVRPMMPHAQQAEGAIWLSAICVVPDATGRERLVGHYTRRKSLAEELEQGICVYNDDLQIFESARVLPLEEDWRRPSGHPVRYRSSEGDDFLLFGSPNPNVRVRPTLEMILDPAQYEALTCRRSRDPADKPDIDATGVPRWRWQKELPPVGSAQELAWIRAGKLAAQQARFAPASEGDPAERVELHSGTVRWNAYRQRWVLIACQARGDASLLGEIWYAEGDDPSGPFGSAVKVLTHDRQTFYNVCHHDFLDQDDGRSIHFEGTYADTFSGNPIRTPRYNYNQVLYRLRLDHPALKPAQPR